MSVQTERTDSLAESEIFHILGNDRRRAIVGLLADRRETVAVSDVASEIADRESSESQVPNNLYKSVYVSLQQTHLPQLEEDDVIEYDPDAKTIEPGAQFDDVLRYIDGDDGSNELVLNAQLALAVAGLVVIALAGSNAPLIGLIGPVLWAILVLMSIAICSLYSLYA